MFVRGTRPIHHLVYDLWQKLGFRVALLAGYEHTLSNRHTCRTLAAGREKAVKMALCVARAKRCKRKGLTPPRNSKSGLERCLPRPRPNRSSPPSRGTRPRATTCAARWPRNSPIPPSSTSATPNKSLIKFHGSYQQEDRDARKNRGKAGVGKAYMFMIRLKLPGGKLTADQYLAMDDICGQVRQRHAAHHDAAELPVPRRAEAEPEDHHRGDQRCAADHARGLRRHQPQRHLPARPRCQTPPASR